MKSSKINKLVALVAAGMLALTGCSAGSTQAVNSTEDVEEIGRASCRERV